MATLPGISIGLGLESEQFVRGVRNADQQMTRFAQQTTSATRTMRVGWSGLASDIRVASSQIAAGRSAIEAIGIQATQALARFGPLGAIIGVTGIAVASLVSALRDSEGAAEAMKIANDALERSFAKSGATIESLIKSYKDLSHEQRATQALGLQEQARQAAEELQKLDRQFADIVSRLGRGTIFAPNFRRDNPLLPLIESFEAGRITADQFTSAMARQAEVTGRTDYAEAAKELTGLTLAMKEQRDAIDAAAKAGDVLERRYDGLAAGQRRLNAAIKDSIGLFDQVAKDRRAAANAARREAEQASAQQAAFDRRKIEQQFTDLAQISERTIRAGNTFRRQQRLAAEREQEQAIAEQARLMQQAAEEQARLMEMPLATALDDLADNGDQFASTMEDIFR